MASDEHDGPAASANQDGDPAAATTSIRPFTIVGIGASAGGLEAMGELIKNLEIDNSAFVVVQHLAPTHDSMLTELLSRSTKMIVATITDGMTVEPNRIYVIPPNADVAILHGVLHLMPPPEGRGPRLAIDYFLRSLAADQGESAIGVILSGAGTDGTFGLKAIKAEGGITFVQDPATACYDGMPRSALESGYADFCLPPAELGQELSRISKHPYLAREPGADTLRVQEHLGKIFVLVRKEFGNDLTYYKRSTIERRIERRMALHKIERLADYVRYLQTHPDELGVLYKDILISVTSFFRDRAPFEILKNQIFPRIVAEKAPGEPIRVWSAGCSTGEEAYSAAICLLEVLGDRALEYKLQVFGTDIDHRAVQHARRGCYPENIALDVSPERLARFFRKQGHEYQVNRNVREMLVFATQNLAKDAPFSRVDLVTCRNVLIYLQPVLQKKVLRILHYALRPGGYLMLGTSETVGDSPDLFSLVERKNKLYLKKDVASIMSPDFTVGSGAADELPVRVTAPGAEARVAATAQQLADRKLLDRYAPPGVLVNENLDIIQFRGRTGPYLEALPGAASLHILKHVRPELQSELRGALQRARTDDAPVTSAAIALGDGADGKRRSVTIDVIPVHDAGARSGCLLVVFNEPDAAPRKPPPPSPPAGPATAQETAVQDLERELHSTKDYLQRTIEELETANEELKSSNEELQSSNEELQSTNEELETSKEELQSSNEELTTVNDELQDRMSELSLTNDDLSNLLSGLSSAVVITGIDLRIRRYSHAAEEVFKLVASDLGRSIGHLTPHVKSVDLERLAEQWDPLESTCRHASLSIL